MLALQTLMSGASLASAKGEPDGHVRAGKAGHCPPCSMMALSMGRLLPGSYSIILRAVIAAHAIIPNPSIQPMSIHDPVM